MEMSSRRLTFVLLASLTFPPAAAAGEQELMVEHVPSIVRPTYQPDASPPYHLWTYETRVTNRADVPVRIDSFTMLYHSNHEWRKQGRVFGAQEFTEWYTDGDRVEDGWIQPGETAVDGRNWNRGGPAPGRLMWQYLAEDARGNRYVGEQEVVAIPGLPPEGNWNEYDLREAASVTVRVMDAEGAPLPYAQLRVGGFPGQGEAQAAYETETGEVEIEIPPGYHLLEVYAPGRVWRQVALAFEAQSAPRAVTVRMSRNDSSEIGAVQFDLEAAPAEAAAVFYDAWKTANEDLFAAMEAYRAEHLDTAGFTYDLSQLLTTIEAAMASDQPQPLRELAALLLFNTPTEKPEPLVAVALAILPPSSSTWGAFPQVALNAAFQSPDPPTFLERLSADNPDRAVRALALASRALDAKGQRNVVLLTELCERLETDYLDVPTIAQRLDDLRRADLLVKGQPAPAFDLARAGDEGRVTSAGLAGRFYLLHFWATWCGPCLAEMAELDAAYARYAGSGLQFVSITLDHEWRTAETYRKQRWPMPWVHVFEGDIEDFDALFGIHAVPALFLVDPRGVIVADTRDLRGSSLEPTLGTFLEE